MVLGVLGFFVSFRGGWGGRGVWGFFSGGNFLFGVGGLGTVVLGAIGGFGGLFWGGLRGFGLFWGGER